MQNPVRLDDLSEPQPDFALLRPRADFYRGAHARPADVLLLIEVADTSLDYDRAVKRALYARHAIPEFWIVDLTSAEVEVCREPGADGYAAVVRVEPRRSVGAGTAARRSHSGFCSLSLSLWSSRGRGMSPTL